MSTWRTTPEQIYLLGTSYWKAGRLFNDELRRTNDPCWGFPCHTADAFVVELLLKAIVAAETGYVPNDHELEEIYNQISPQTRARIESRYDSEVLTEDIVRSFGVDPTSLDFEFGILAEIRQKQRLFSEFRYLHEAEEFTAGDGLPLVQSLRDEGLWKLSEADVNRTATKGNTAGRRGKAQKGSQGHTQRSTDKLVHTAALYGEAAKLLDQRAAHDKVRDHAGYAIEFFVSLATELYLKTIYEVTTGTRATNTHNQWKIVVKLPRAVREQIESHIRRTKPNWERILQSLLKSGFPYDMPIPQMLDDEIEAHFFVSSAAFIRSRYAYEHNGQVIHSPRWLLEAVRDTFESLSPAK